MRLVDSTRRRPGRGWYAVAGVVAVLGLMASVAVLAAGIWSWVGDFPTLGAQFRDGESVRVHLEAGRPAVLYVSPDTSASVWRCTGEVAGSPVAVTEAPYTFTFFSGGRTWAARYEIRAERAGSARLTCSALTGAGTARLAVGDKPDNSHLIRKLAGTIAAGACVAVLGLGVGGALALVVRKRRKTTFVDRAR